MLNVVENIICSEFDKRIKRGQFHEAVPKAMKVEFQISLDYDLEDGYRTLSLLIYAPHNYVGVFVKEDWTVIPVDELEESDGDTDIKVGCDYRQGETGWRLVCYHDSCWRSDGVHNILRLHHDRINGLKYMDTWYETIELTKKLQDELEEMLDGCGYRDEKYRYEYMRGVLQFEKGPDEKIIEKKAGDCGL